MSRRTAVAAAITVVAVVLLGIEAFSWPQSARFGALSASTFRCTVRLDTVSDLDRAAGLRQGDFIDLQRMSTAGRTAGVFHNTPTQAGRAGERFDVAVSRTGRELRIPYTLRHTDPFATFAAQMLFKIVLIGIAAFLLWRGSDASSVTLAIWCTGVGLGLPDAWWGALPVWGRVGGGLITSLLWTFSPFVLYLVVESLATGVSPWEKRVARAAMLVLLVPSVVVNCINATAQAIGGCAFLDVPAWPVAAAFTASQGVIIAFFVLGYLRTAGLARERIRWVFYAFLVSRAGVLLNLANRLAAHPLHLSGFEWATVVVFPLGCAYAILRHRLFNVNFVLNRTLAYTFLTTAVVGLFIVIEDILGKAAASRGIGIAVDVSVALLLGFSFNALHRYVEGAIERALFRSKHDAANALRRLAEEVPFMESSDALLARTVDETRAVLGAAAVLVYERIDGVYRLSAMSGAGSAPGAISIDDIAFVRLRKTRGPLELADAVGSLGSDGAIFPFLIRAALTGALVCRRRASGEAFAPDEMALLAGVAHEVGAEISAIRARHQAEVLDAVLGGTMTISDARARL